MCTYVRMGKLYYPAVLELAANGEFGVFFPDLPGCVSGGHNEREAWASAEAALELHVAGLIEDGNALPEPSRPSALVPDHDVAQVAIALIGVKADQPKVRVNVVLDAALLDAIDRNSDNRSAFLSRAARRQLAEVGGAVMPVKSKGVPG